MTYQTVCTGSEKTEQLGALLAKLLRPPIVLELRSDLGGGKTTFTRGLARGLGYVGRVASPTFTLNQTYNCKNGIILSHFDLYRLAEPGLLAEQLTEAMADKQTITVVEWADSVKKMLPENCLSLVFQPAKINPDERLITFMYPEKQSEVIEKLKEQWLA